LDESDTGLREVGGRALASELAKVAQQVGLVAVAACERDLDRRAPAPGAYPLNEFLAFRDLGVLVEAGALSPRSIVITSYALCGFANFGSLAILLGGVGGMAPSRRGDLARLGLRSILAGTLATMMTGCVAGILL
jgi:hypothetical protein